MSNKIIQEYTKTERYQCIRWDGNNTKQISDLSKEAESRFDIITDIATKIKRLRVQTMANVILVSKGDWIIKEKQGYFDKKKHNKFIKEFTAINEVK